MTVVAIMCEGCNGHGLLVRLNGMAIEAKACELCNGTGTETPPQPDHDRNARKDIEGKTEHE
jgi:DnaJ-class molecular chaperone